MTDRKNIIRFVLLALAAGLVIGRNLPNPPEIIVKPDETQVQQAGKDVTLINAVNEYRASKNQPALVNDELLNKSAQVRADEIAGTSDWSHTRPDGTPFSTAVANWQATWAGVGENLARCAGSNQDAIIAWEKSPTHDANMLGGLSTGTIWGYAGQATAWDKTNRCMVYVVHFGRK